jgi:hypothetical protein
MCTIIKVKRKITDDPVDCLILECKKKKFMPQFAEEKNESNKKITENDDDNKIIQENEKDRIDSIKQILKYAGSAKNEVWFCFTFFATI